MNSVVRLTEGKGVYKHGCFGFWFDGYGLETVVAGTDELYVLQFFRRVKDRRFGTSILVWCGFSFEVVNLNLPKVCTI
jgi:hypothetical protein